MEVLLWGLSGVLLFVILLLLIKIHLLQKAAKEIEIGFAEKLKGDTNTLISISSQDRTMRSLADSINKNLKIFRSERQRFEQGDLAVKDAVTNISHDLRTPLTSICGYLDLLEGELSSGDTMMPMKTAAKYFNVIRTQTDVLKQLTEELFRYSVVALTGQEYEAEEVVLNHVLEECISAHYAALKSCRITPDISIPQQKVIRVLNKNALCRILENILNNAMKYSDGDLRITLSEHGEIVCSNHARNLDEVQVQRLFDRLYTVETAKKSTGLGLSIAKSLTEQMHGTISAGYSEGMLSICIRFL